MRGEIFSTDAPVDDPYGEQAARDETAEYVREQDWQWMAADAATFAKKYGAGALLRCIADGLGPQIGLLK